MAFTEEHIAAFIGDPTILERARHYLRQGRVRSIKTSGPAVEGEIRGSGTNVYHALVTLSHGVLHGSCSCPYPLLCKHIGALLLQAMRAGSIPREWETLDTTVAGSPHSSEDEWDPEWSPAEERAFSSRGGRRAPDEAPPAPLGVRDLTQDRTHRHFWSIVDAESGEYQSRLLSNDEVPGPGSHVLHLTIVAEPRYEATPGSELRVTPLVRYIRKDGTEGALSPWRPSTECLVRTSAEMALLPLLNRREGRKVPLTRLLAAQILNEAPPPLWISQPTEGYPSPPVLLKARFTKIQRLSISFFPVRYTGESVLFEPYLSVESDDGGRHPLTGRMDDDLARWIEAGKRRFLIERRIDLLENVLGRWTVGSREERPYWVDVEDGICLLVDRLRGEVYWSDDPVLGELLWRIDPGAGREFSYPDILGMRGHLRRRDGRGAVELILPPARAEIVELSPTLRIEIDDGTVSMSADVHHREVDGEAKDDLLLLEFYDNDAAGLRVQTLANRCFELLRPLNPWQERTGRLRCDGSVEEIVECIAEAMVDAGAHLRISGRPVRVGEPSFALRVVASGEDWFSLRLTATIDGKEATIAPGGSIAFAEDGTATVIRNRRELQRMMERLRISEEGTIRIQEGDFDQLSELSGLLEYGPDGSESKATRRAEELLRKASERREAWGRLAGKMDSLDRGAPPGFCAVLRPYQRHGFAWLVEATREGFGPLLADDMGLGKTVQALALLQAGAVAWAESSDSAAPPLSLVVAPPATIENWRHETHTFAPALTPIIYHGGERAMTLQDLLSESARGSLSGAPLLITSYQTLLKDVEPLSEVSWDHLIFDEVQTIKNARTKSYRAARRLQAKHKLALSGTPVENSSLELFAIIDLLNPGILGNRAAFTRRFGAPIERDNDPDASRRLRELLAPIILRRRKAEVAKDLPPRDEIPLYVSLPPYQRAVYEELRASYQERIKNALAESGPGKRLFLILEGLTRLRQAAVDPRLLPSSKDGPASGSKGSAQEPAKLSAFGEIVAQVTQEGHRILVFSQFVSLLTILRAWADKRGYRQCYLDGSMSPARRRQEIARFQESREIPLFFISLRAGGLGINLTAADYVIIMDPWWNPAVEQQAIDRSHRIGQTQPVTAYRLIATETVEERIAALQERKRALATSIVPDESALISSLSTEEILELFAP